MCELSVIYITTNTYDGSSSDDGGQSHMSNRQNIKYCSHF